MNVTAHVASFLVAVASLTASRSQADTSPGDDLAVSCPAIERDERRRTNYPGESGHPVCLVVQGKIKTIRKASEGDGVFEIAVEKVIYGGHEAKTVRFKWAWNFADQQAIIALAPAMYGDVPYEFRYTMSPDEVPSQEALARARLDYTTLSSEAIFLGKELSADDDYRRTVEIIRSLHGPALTAATKVTFVDRGYVRHAGMRPAVRSAPMIYFVQRVAPPRRGEPVVYYLSSRIAGNQAANVAAALKRRAAYPVRPRTTKDVKVTRIREITYTGSAEEAVALLGSTSEAAVMLGTRKLLLSGKIGRATAVAEIKKTVMSRVSPAGIRGLRRLRNLIRFLGAADNGNDDLAGLLDHMINSIVSGTPAPQTPERESYDWHRREADRIDTNHALLWLLQAMDKDTVLSKYATRLIKLRDDDQGRWKKELQLALEAANVLDGLELRTAAEKASKLKPTRVATGFAVAGGQVVFAPNGEQLIVDGKIHQMSDWSQTGLLASAGNRRILFAPDGKRFFVLGYDQTDVAIIQWPSGKVLNRFKGHKEPITSGTLSADGKTLMTASYYEDVVHIWDTTAGKIEKSYTMSKGCYNAALSPDGKTLVLQNAKNELTVQPIAGGKSITLEVSGHELNEAIFTPDGRFLVVLSYGYTGVGLGSVPRLAIHAVEKAYAKVASLNIKGASNRCTALAIAPDGRQLVVGSQEGRVWAVDLPALNKSRRLIADKTSGNINAGELAFSADGKLLAVGASYGNVRLFNGDTFEPVSVGPAHQGEMTNAYFSADGKTIRTFGEYGFLCHWDADTLKLRKRFALPPGTKPMAIRSPDGRYVFCASAAELGVLFSGKATSPVIVVDAENGNSISKVKIPLNARVLWTVPQQAVVLDWGTWQHINYINGKELRNRDVDITSENELYNKRGQITEDGTRLLLWNRTGGKFATNSIEVWTVDVETGKSSRKTKTPQVIRGGYNASGLVPGGRYFYIADPDMYILNRTTGKVVAHRRFGKSDLLKIAFSPDGAYYAAVTGGRTFIDRSLRQWDPETTSVVRIHESISGKTVLAFPAPTRWVRTLRFSPDGRQLLVAGKDLVEVWPIRH